MFRLSRIRLSATHLVRNTYGVPTEESWREMTRQQLYHNGDVCGAQVVTSDDVTIVNRTNSTTQTEHVYLCRCPRCGPDPTKRESILTRQILQKAKHCRNCFGRKCYDEPGQEKPEPKKKRCPLCYGLGWMVPVGETCKCGVAHAPEGT